MRAPLPANESQRLLALRRYGILDTESERAFDGLARIAAHLFQVPFALVSFVDEERQWLKSHIGVNLCETGRDVAFCAHAIVQPDPLVVLDARLDPRFSDNPLVTGYPGIRFYAGVPLLSHDGFALGTLCVIDVVPREQPRPSEIQVLQGLAEQVVDQLELRLARRKLLQHAEHLEQRQRDLEALNHQLRLSENRLRLALDSGKMGSFEYDGVTGRLVCSDTLRQICGLPAEEPILPSDWISLIHPDDRVPVLEAYAAASSRGHQCTYRIIRPDGAIRWVESRAVVELHRSDRWQYAHASEHPSKILAAMGVLWDITTAQQVQQDRQRLLLERSALLNSMAAGMIGVDTAGLCMFLNPRAEELLEVSEQESLGRSITDLICAFSEGLPLNPVADTLESALEVHSDTAYFRSTSGRRIPVEYHSSPLIRRRTVEGAVLSFSDITERKRNEAERAELLRQLDHAVRDLGRVQRGMILSAPAAADLKLDLCLHPKHAAGGDFLCQYRLPDGRDFVLLTDVSGHDLRAAYFSAYSHGMVRAMLDRGASLEGVFAGLSDDLLEKASRDRQSDDLSIEVAISACAMVYDSARERLSVLSAGSPSPVYVDEAGVPETLLLAGSQPLGWFHETLLSARELSVSRGFVLMWTDGLEDLAFTCGVTPLTLAVTLLRANSEASPVPCLAQAQDDVISAAVRFPGDTRGVLERWIPLLDESYAPADAAEIDLLQARWSRNLEFAIPGLRDASLFDVLLCSREAVLNGLNHGCANGGLIRLSICYNIALSRVLVRVSDPGPGHDFSPDVHETDDLLDRHRGLFLIRQFAHEVRTDRNGASLEMLFHLRATSLTCREEEPCEALPVTANANDGD